MATVTQPLKRLVHYMHLMDQIFQSAGDKKSPALGLLSHKVGSAAVRYILTPEISEVCDSLISDHFEMLADMTDLVRVGEDTMWIERRANVPDELGICRRIGLLVEADCDGRSGTITIAIEIPGQPPLVMPQGLVFDFGGNVGPSDGFSQFSISDLATPGTQRLSGCFAIRLLPEWREYYALDARPADIRKELMDEMARSAMPDGLFLMAFSALMMSRKSFREVPSMLNRLNRSRKKSGKPELLEYLEVKAHLIANDHHYEGRSHGERQPSRMHHVRGHFVRRGDLLYWRSPHLRGDPERMILRKTVHLGL